MLLFSSQECQTKHWQDDHKSKCKPMNADKLSFGFEANSKKSSGFGRISLVPTRKKLKKVIGYTLWPRNMYASAKIFMCGPFAGSGSLFLWWISKSVQPEGLWFYTLWAFELWQQVWRSYTLFCSHLFASHMLLKCTSLILFHVCSCFANVVLQCLSCTRPLVAYLLGKDHSRECTWLSVMSNRHLVLCLKLFKSICFRFYKTWRLVFLVWAAMPCSKS